jgi:hypothetical protein
MNIHQKVSSGIGHGFSGTGDVHVERHHYAHGTAPPSQSQPFELVLIDRAWQEDGSLLTGGRMLFCAWAYEPCIRPEAGELAESHAL